VSPQETTKYISEYTFTNAAGDVFVLHDTTLIRVSIPSITATSNMGNNNICPNDPARLSVTVGDEFPMIHPASYQWSSSEEDTNALCIVTPSQSKTYSVTVTFDNGCTQTDTVRVYVTDLEFPTITGDDTICLGESSTLVATHPTSNEYHWSSGQSTSTITVSPQITTEYVVSATMTGNCIVTDTFTVVVIPLPRPSFIATPTEIFVENGIGTVMCNNLSPDGYFLTWDFGDPFSNTNIVHDVEDPSHDYTRAGYYTITLTAEDTLGCIDSTKTRVSVSVPYFFYVPNSFTPDGDGINETFAPKGEGVDPDNYLMEIFDRTGMLIFSTHSPYDYWDGRNKYGQMCPEGVYIYLIRLKDLNAEDKEYMGTVTLVR
jgi:gliding motility-associated-like protein